MDRFVRQSRQRRQVYLHTLEQIREFEQQLRELHRRGYSGSNRGALAVQYALEASIREYEAHARRLRAEARQAYEMANAGRFRALYRRLPRDMQYEVDRRR